jgi:hypothetical protein
VEEAAALLRAYRITWVRGDRYGGEWPRESFRRSGVGYSLAEETKSDLYLELVAVVNSGKIELIDDPELLRELRGLERRRGSSGRDRVDHAPGCHDDRANAIAGLASMLPRSIPRAKPEPELPRTTMELFEQHMREAMKARARNRSPRFHKWIGRNW